MNKEILNMQKKNIEAITQDLITKVRQYSSGQKNLWQLIPYLALEADGRTGYSDNYGQAYQRGIWRVESSIDRIGYRAGVDLATGELLDLGTYKPALDEVVIKIASAIDELDAATIITELTEDAQELYSSCYKAKEQESWREKMRDELQLTPKYQRRGSLKQSDYIELE